MRWFDGSDAIMDSDLTSAYSKEQKWRGNRVEWTRKCKAKGLDPLYNWTKYDLNLE